MVRENRWVCEENSDTVMCADVEPIGHVFSLTLILYGTREDPLASNPHVNRGIKKVETVDINQRKRGT